MNRCITGFIKPIFVYSPKCPAHLMQMAPSTKRVMYNVLLYFFVESFVVDQCKVVNIYEVEEKLCMICKILINTILCPTFSPLHADIHK